MTDSYPWDTRSTKTSRAVAYYRHSDREKQEHSIPIQRQHARKFAAENGIEIIHEEHDKQTGLSANRPGFQSLFNNWILNDAAPDFEYILVYDVTRFGRFQNQNESAHYEFICNKRGKTVVYVEHGFAKEDEPITYIQTAFERYMAAEYSRQLSNKVFYGSVEVSKQGYSAGGTACYGMARLLLDEQKKPVRLLKPGERKQIANERVTFVPLNNQATKIVKIIFQLFVEKNLSPSAIADHLNQNGFASAASNRWDRSKVLRILSNEIYAGTRIYNKTWNRLHQKRRKNPRTEWVIRPGAFPAIVDKRTFSQAQEKLCWANLKQWKASSHALDQAGKVVRRYLNALLEQRENNGNNFPFLIDHFPLAFSVGIPAKGKTLQWCFILPERMRDYSAILGIGVKTGSTQPVESVFLIPSSAFSVGGLRIVATDDKRYHKWHLAPSELGTAITSLLQEVRNKTNLDEP